jgi:hypothetical protein
VINVVEHKNLSGIGRLVKDRFSSLAKNSIKFLVSLPDYRWKSMDYWIAVGIDFSKI